MMVEDTEMTDLIHLVEVVGTNYKSLNLYLAELNLHLHPQLPTYMLMKTRKTRLRSHI